MQRLLRQQQRALTVAPDFFDLPHEDLQLTASDGVALAAWFVPAAGDSPLMALLHHHFGEQKAAVLPWIELLHRLGVPCLAFDARGHGASRCTPEQAAFVPRLADVRAAARELRRRGAQRLLGLGLSQGAAVVIAALADDPLLSGLIVDSGPAALALPSLWGMTGAMLASSPPRPRGTRLLATWMLRRRVRPRGYSRHLFSGLLRSRRLPLLWLHGSDDRIIARRWVSAWFSPLSLAAPRWRAVRVAGAEHAQCLQHGAEEVTRAVADLIDEIAPSVER
jgi:alpha-beta hydrolase superfamily lysophospholipase